MKKKISIISLVIGFLLIGYGLYSVNNSFNILTREVGAAASPTGFVIFPVGALSSLFLGIFTFSIGFVFIWLGIRISFS